MWVEQPPPLMPAGTAEVKAVKYLAPASAKVLVVVAEPICAPVVKR